MEHGIDDAFDRFELFVLRNTFTVPTELVPFIALSHQVRNCCTYAVEQVLTAAQKDHIDVELKGKDLDAIREYEEQLRLYEQELDKERQLACVEELMRRKLEQTQERAQEIGYMGSAGGLRLSFPIFHSAADHLLNAAEPLSARAQGLLPQLRLLQERLVKLSDTAAPPTQGPAPTEGDPWTTRSAFVNWAATSKINSLPAAPTPGQTGASEDAAISQIHDKMGKTGKQEDAAVSQQSVILYCEITNAPCCATQSLMDKL